MALKATLTAEEFAELDENIKLLYIEKDDNYILDLEDIDLPNDKTDDTEIEDQKQKLIEAQEEAVRKYREAIEKERNITKQYRALGRTPEQIKEMVEREEQIRTEKLKNEGEFDKLLHQNEVKWEAELNEHKQQIERIEAAEKSAIVSHRLTNALAKAKFTKAGIDLLPDSLSSRIKVEGEPGARTITILTSEGEPMAGKGKSAKATFDDLAFELAEKYPDLVFSKIKPGSGMSTNTGDSKGKKTMSRSQFDSLEQNERSTAMKDGYTLTED